MNLLIDHKDLGTKKKDKLEIDKEIGLLVLK